MGCSKNSDTGESRTLFPGNRRQSSCTSCRLEGDRSPYKRATERKDQLGSYVEYTHIRGECSFERLWMDTMSHSSDVTRFLPVNLGTHRNIHARCFGFIQSRSTLPICADQSSRKQAQMGSSESVPFLAEKVDTRRIPLDISGIDAKLRVSERGRRIRHTSTLRCDARYKILIVCFN